MIVVQSQLSRKDFLAISSLLSLRSLVVMVVIRGFLVVAALRIARYPSLLPAIVTTILFVIFQVFSVIRSCFTSRNRNLLLPNLFVLREETITITTPVSVETIRWEALIAWKRMAGHYLMFSADNQYYCIRETSIATENLDEFKELLGQKVPKRRRIRRLR